VVEEVEAEIKQVERELAEARRAGAQAEELSAIRDILYEDKWFRIATAVYVHLKRQFAEDGEAAEVIEAAERRLFGLRLEVVEAPLLKIEAAVDRDGRVAAVRCRVALDLGVEAVYVGVAPGYKLEKTAGKTAGTGAEATEETATSAEAALDERRREEEGGVERVLEEVRREFSGLPVHVAWIYADGVAPLLVHLAGDRVVPHNDPHRPCSLGELLQRLRVHEAGDGAEALSAYLSQTPDQRPAEAELQPEHTTSGAAL
jgi:hypothetical protein